MSFLDMKTVVFGHIVSDAICAVALGFIWYRNRHRYSGLSLWTTDYVLQTMAVILVTLRGTIPDVLSMILANTLVMTGALIMFIGLERFVDRSGSQIHNYTLLIIFIMAFSFFTINKPNLTIRNMLISVTLIIFTSQCVWLLFRRVEPALSRITRGVGLVFGGYCLLSLVRIAFIIIIEPDRDYEFMQSGPAQAILLLAYQMLAIILTYSLALMVNRRLLAEISLQEEKFSKAFQTSPYAITITRLSDGQILEVNNAFCHITGFQAKEAIGKTTIDLHLWVTEKDRQFVASELLLGHSIQRTEFPFQKKSGETLVGVFSAEIILINNQQYVLSSIADITEKKQIEELLKESEWKYRLLAENIQEVFWMATPKLDKMIYVSPAYEKTWGRSRQSLYDNPRLFLDAIHPQDRPRVMEVLKTNRVQGSPWSVIYRVVRPDGSISWVEDRGFPAYDDLGNWYLNTGVASDITQRVMAEQEREKIFLALQEAVSKVNLLSGLLPICSNCKKIRNDRGYWEQIEVYISEHSNADFTHGICPECLNTLYGDFLDGDLQ